MQLKKEQATAINHNEGNILISASAGSGKTFVMIQRLIRLIIEKRATVKEILAVTFTEAAALEMKEKLKNELTAEIEKGRVELTEELFSVATADICTLHAFCSRLIRKYFFALEISPDYSVADQTVAESLKREAIDNVFKKFYDLGEPWFENLVERYRTNRRDEALKNSIISISEFISSEENPELFLSNCLSTYKKENFNSVLEKYKDVIDVTLDEYLNCLIDAEAQFSGVGFEKGATFARELYEDILSAKTQDIYHFKTLDGYKKDVFRNKIPDSLESAKAMSVLVRDGFVKLIKRVNAHIHDRKTDERIFASLYSDTQDMITVINAYEKEYAGLKRDENLLDFNDLERFTLKLLQDEKIAEEIKNSYKFVFIDEYQDTNGVQESIVSKITKDNLFMVGDVKQSIYGFRGCRPEIFINKFDKMAKENETVLRLNCNFRSAKAVIDMVNAIFSYSMTKEFYGSDYAVDSMLVGGGIYPEDKTGRAELHILNGKTERTSIVESPRIYNVKEEFLKTKEGDSVNDVSLLVGELIRKELGKTYYDFKEKREKSVTYADIAILTRNRNTEYVSGLVGGLIRQGLPVASEVKHNVCDYPEVCLLINALKLIDCFNQDVPLVTVMKSPIGNFTEEELSHIAYHYASESKDTEKFFYKAFLFYKETAEDGELKEKVKSFYEYFGRIRFLADFIGAKGVLEQVILDSDLENCYLASGLGENKVKRVRKFLFEAQNGNASLTVKEFLKKIELSSSGFELSMTAEENTVKVTTIHASKGLEYPVVIVCGLELMSRGDDVSGTFVKDREYGFALKYFDDDERRTYETPVRGLIAEKSAIATMKEELRLFYVATTRAKYSLHLTYKCSKDSRRNRFVGAERFIHYIPKNLPASVWDKETLEFYATTTEKRKVLVGKASEEEAEKMKKNFGFGYGFLTDVTLPLKTSVTEINKQGVVIKAAALVEEAVTDNEKGNVAHKVLELFDFTSGEEFYSQVEKMPIDKGDLEKIDLTKIKSAITGAPFSELKRKDIYKEQPFIVSAPASEVLGANSKENVLVQGIIDLLVIDGDTAKVIDYKYSKHGGKVLKERYKKQLDFYARAVGEVLGKTVTEKIIVNLLSGERVSID